MRIGKALKPNWKLDITRANNILNLKVLEFSWKTKFLNNAGILEIQTSVIMQKPLRKLDPT